MQVWGKKLTGCMDEHVVSSAGLNSWLGRTIRPYRHTEAPWDLMPDIVYRQHHVYVCVCVCVLCGSQVGIPTHSRRGSNLPSGTSTAAMSFSDDLPTLEGLPQMRYPRQSGQPSLTSRHSSSRRTNNDGLATGSSGGGGRNGPLRSSRQAAASGGGASAGGAAGSGAPGGGGAPPVRGSSVPMLPILEAPGSTDSQASTLAALPPPTLGASPLGIVKQDSCRVTQGPSAVAENTVRMSSDLSRLLPPETAKMVWAEKPCAARTPLRA